MRIDEQARRCVAFLSIENKSRVEGCTVYQPVGTAFFVGEEIGSERWVMYVVTARHVIDGTRPQGALFIRAISPDRQKRKLFCLPHEAWWCHPTADVAVAPVVIPLQEYGLAFLPTYLLADDVWVRENDIGAGDHLAVPGLLSHYIGIERDEPAVRFGRISLIPKGRIKVPGQAALPSMEMEAILAELAAWPGQSGSPAFVYFSLDRGLFSESELRFELPNPRLLGLLHGHYTVPENVREREEEYTRAYVPLNSGVAIIVPASRILEVLRTDEAEENRLRIAGILREEGLLD